jgi:acyl dehydratase
MANKAMIGTTFEPVTATIDTESIKAFARALGETDPLYVDEAAAKASPFGALVAPPTYPIAFMAQSMAGAAGSFEQLGLNFMTLVHGEQEFEYTRPVKAGDTLTLTARIADVSEKQGRSGILDILVLETEARDPEGKPVFTSRQTLVSKRA